MFAKDRSISLYPYEPWGFDNGAFKAWSKGEKFPDKIFLKRLDKAYRVSTDPLVAVCPDVVAGGLDSLEFSLGWLRRLPSDWPWYLAVQDGMTHESVAEVVHLFSGIFLGGTDRFKLTAYGWSRLAHSCGKKFHYGRAGTLRKLAHAHAVEADSLDSNFPLWSTGRMFRFRDHDDAIRSGEQARFDCVF
jgi:hypothetical protein